MPSSRLIEMLFVPTSPLLTGLIRRAVLVESVKITKLGRLAPEVSTAVTVVGKKDEIAGRL